MKQQYVTLLAFLLSASAILFSCDDKKKNVGELTFDSISISQTEHLFGDTARPACNLTIQFVYPAQSKDAALKDTLTSHFIAACFDEKYAGKQPQEVMQEYTKEYINSYRTDLEPMYQEDLKNNSDKQMIGGWYSYFKHIEGRVQFYEQNLLVYKAYYDEYTGGAHSMYATHFLNIDLTTMKPLHLDDLFDVPDYREILTDLIWNQLMAEHNVTTHEELEDLGFGVTGEIAPVENFYLDHNGITFFYNVYDIAPYSNGPVSVTIPFSMMERILGTHAVLKALKE